MLDANIYLSKNLSLPSLLCSSGRWCSVDDINDWMLPFLRTWFILNLEFSYWFDQNICFSRNYEYFLGGRGHLFKRVRPAGLLTDWPAGWLDGSVNSLNHLFITCPRIIDVCPCLNGLVSLFNDSITLIHHRYKTICYATFLMDIKTFTGQQVI